MFKWLILIYSVLSGAVGFSQSSTISQLNDLLQNHWAPYVLDPQINPCIDHTPGKRAKDEFHPEAGKCEIGDMLLFNSLLCYSGEIRGCNAAWESQSRDPFRPLEYGRIWRNPYAANPNLDPRFDYRWNEQRVFSRDHFMGFLLYLVSDPDRVRAKAAAIAAVNYINGLSRYNALQDVTQEVAATVKTFLNQSGRDLPDCVGNLGNCLKTITEDKWEALSRTEKIACGIITVIFPPAGLVCPDYVKKIDGVAKKLVEVGLKAINIALPSVCSEAGDNCFLLPHQYSMLGRVLKDLGAFSYLAPDLQISYELTDILVTEGVILEIFSHVQDKGFERQVMLVTGILRQKFDLPNAKMFSRIHTLDPNNPLAAYHYNRHVDGNISIDDVASMTIKMAPGTTNSNDGFNQCNNLYDKRELADGTSMCHGDQWSWERNSENEEWVNSMGWDFILVTNLLNRAVGLPLPIYTNVRDFTNNLYREFYNRDASDLEIEIGYSEFMSNGSNLSNYRIFFERRFLKYEIFGPYVDRTYSAWTDSFPDISTKNLAVEGLVESYLSQGVANYRGYYVDFVVNQHVDKIFRDIYGQNTPNSSEFISVKQLLLTNNPGYSLIPYGPNWVPNTRQAAEYVYYKWTIPLVTNLVIINSLILQ